jgi:hypothetical protein
MTLLFRLAERCRRHSVGGRRCGVVDAVAAVSSQSIALAYALRTYRLVVQQLARQPEIAESQLALSVDENLRCGTEIFTRT